MEFTYGQLVAVRDSKDSEWKLRAFHHSTDGCMMFCFIPDEPNTVQWWNQVAPAEDVWPDLFFGREK